MKPTAFVEINRKFVIDTLKDRLFHTKQYLSEKEDKFNKDCELYNGLPLWKKIFSRNPASFNSMYYPSALYERAGYLYDLIWKLENQIEAFELSDKESILVNSDSWIIRLL